MISKKLSKTKLIITYFTIFLLAGNTLLPYDDSFARRGGGGRGGGGFSRGGESKGGAYYQPFYSGSTVIYKIVRVL